LPPIIFIKWKRNLDQGALTQRVQDAATDTESSQPGKAQDVRREGVFITTEMIKVKAQMRNRAEVSEERAMEVTVQEEVLAVRVTEVTDQEGVTGVHVTEEIDQEGALEISRGVLETDLSEGNLMMTRRGESTEKERVTEINQEHLATVQEEVLAAHVMEATVQEEVLGISRGVLETDLSEENLMMTRREESTEREGVTEINQEHLETVQEEALAVHVMEATDLAEALAVHETEATDQEEVLEIETGSRAGILMQRELPAGRR
jgi:hypothetical protein